MSHTEIITTKVRESKKVGASVWLDGGKLNRNQWLKGDTAEITVTSDAIVLRKTDRLERATPRTVNISGRKNPSRGDVSAILELPIKKTTHKWDIDLPLKVKVTRKTIIISINSFLVERKKRAAKFLEFVRTKRAKSLVMCVADLPIKPHENISEQADIVSMAFDVDGQGTSQFYNALRTIETANPFALEVVNFESTSNPLGYGMVSILRNLEYKTYHVNKRLIAVSEDIAFELDSVINSDTNETIFDLMAVETQTRLSCKFGSELGLKAKRTEQLEKDLSDKTIRTISLFHGGGTYEYGAKSVYEGYGFKNELALVTEIEDTFLWHSFEANRECFTEETLVLNGDICSFEPGEYNVNGSLLISGIPCTSSSRASLSKVGHKYAELHAKAGSLFWNTIKFIVSCNPYFYVLENTDSYRYTSGFKSIMLMLDALGYHYEETVLNSHDLGTIESRKRLFLVATSDDSNESLKAINFGSRDHHYVGPRVQINKILDPNIKPDDPSYRLYTHLKEKEIRDKLAGKNFARNMFHGDETRTLLIRAAYAKAGTSDCYLYHPSDKEYSRLFSPVEHARLKGFDDDFVTKPKTNAASQLHFILGQGIPRSLTTYTIDKVLSMAAPQFLKPKLAYQYCLNFAT
jgi:site-specific DNA-cytosine methylase